MAEQAIILFNNEKVKETVAYLIRVGIIRSQMRVVGESTLKNQMDSNNFYLESTNKMRDEVSFSLPTIKLQNSLSVEKGESKISGVDLAQNENLLAELDDQ